MIEGPRMDGDGGVQPWNGERLAIRRQVDAAMDRQIAGLAGRLGRDSQVKQIVQDVLLGEPIGEPISPQKVRTLIDTLVHSKIKPWRSRQVWRWILWSTRVSPEHTERELACWALGQIDLPPEMRVEAVRALRSSLGDENHKRDSAEQSAAVFRGQVRAYLLCVLIGSLLGLLGWGTSQNPNWADLVIGFIGLLFGSIAAILYGGWIFIPISLKQYKRHLIRLKTAAAAALGRQPQPESVDELAYSVSARNSGLVTTSLRALQAVLATLTPDHYGRLAAETVPRLCQALDQRNSLCVRNELGDAGELCFLDALEKVGDGRTVETVQELTTHARTEMVRARAEEVLAVLMERRRQEQDRGMLLRGSQSDTTQSDTLLRAAGAVNTTTPAEQLLRPRQE